VGALVGRERTGAVACDDARCHDGDSRIDEVGVERFEPAGGVPDVDVGIDERHERRVGAVEPCVAGGRRPPIDVESDVGAVDGWN
jgi:hypothetical protein